MAVTLTNVRKVYGNGQIAVQDLSLEIHEGEFFTLLGPSGCGKTTTLRMIAGLEEVSAGTITIRGRDVTAVPARHRDVAMVFQSYALYPHMSVYENLALNLRVRRLPKQEIDERVRQVASMLRIEHILTRKPGQLSGGQRQRVALGRAIVRRPNVFLMDEPLSNLDLKLREETRTELKRLHEKLRITTVYVTHDQSEALVLSDRIGIMNEGRLLQVGNPHEVYARPANMFVARFIGSPSINLIDGHLRSEDNQLFFETSGGPLERLCKPLKPEISHWISANGAIGGITMGIRPEDLVISSTPVAGYLAAYVDFVQPLGAVNYAILRLPDHTAQIRERDHLVAAIGPDDVLPRGTRVWLAPRGERFCLFDSRTGIALA